MKMYLTKYALTKGIIEVETECEEDPKVRTLVSFETGTKFYRGCEYFTEHLFINEEDALIKADKMRRLRIDSLNKSLRKLQSMKIKIKKAT